MIDIAVKDISYAYDKNGVSYTAAHDVAVLKTEEAYKDEQNFCKEEYEAMLADGDIGDMDDYHAYLDLSPEDVDYTLPFEQNKDHPQILQEIESLTQKFMANITDVPREAVVQIDESQIDSKGKPSQAAVLAALQQKFDKDGVSVSGFDAKKTGIAEKKDILTQQAYESVADMMQSKEYQAFLSLRATIQKYSHNNIALIYAQKPDAKAVMGYNAWQKLDRQVPKGQHGLAIWQPCTGEKKSEKAIDAYIEKQKVLFPYYYVTQPDGSCPKADKLKEKMMKELQEKGAATADYGFKLGTTFDISQTVPIDPTKDNLQDIINLNKPLQGDLANYAEVIKSMQDAATIVPLSVSAPQAGQSQQEALFNALLSYADKVLSDSPDKVIGIKSDTPLTGDMHQIETVMTAYMIAEHIGIETGDKAGLKLAEVFDKGLTEQAITIGKREMFMQAFDRAAKLSDMFVKEFDKSFGIDLEAQRDAVRQAAEAKKAQIEAERKAYKESHVRFGKTQMLIADRWTEGKTTYTIGKNEDTNKFFVRTVTGAKAEYIKNDEGNPMSFASQPDRNTVEVLLANQHSDKQASSLAPAKTDAPDADADDKKAPTDIDR